MAYRIVRFETTPNPNAVKCVLDDRISEHPKSFLNPEAAADDPIAEALFALGGIRNILINENWISVNKLDATSWASLKPKLKRIIGELPSGPSAGGAEGVSGDE